MVEEQPEVVEGVPERMQWFRDAALSKTIIWTGQVQMRSLETRTLQVNRHWEAISRGILRREPNHFIEVSMGDATHFDTALLNLEQFGLRVWPVSDTSKYPDPVIKVFIGPYWNYADPQISVDQSNTYKYLLDLEDVNAFGRFLMLRTGEELVPYTGQCLRIRICKHEVPGFCDVDSAFGSLLQIPFLSGLSDHIRVLGVPIPTKLRADYAAEIALRNAYFANHRGRDFFSTGRAISCMIDRHEKAARAGDKHTSYRILREIAQLALTVLVSRFTGYGMIGELSHDSEAGPEAFLLYALRFSAYGMGTIHSMMAVDCSKSKSERYDHDLHALQCMAYALGLQEEDAEKIYDADEISSWKASCYTMMFQVYISLGKEHDAWIALRSLLSLIEEPQLKLYYESFEGPVYAVGWYELAFMRKENYLRAAADGALEWEKSQTFRGNFASDFARTHLLPMLLQRWPGFEGNAPPDMAAFF